MKYREKEKGNVSNTQMGIYIQFEISWREFNIALLQEQAIDLYMTYMYVYIYIYLLIYLCMMNEFR